jgi:hypothetical protein
MVFIASALTFIFTTSFVWNYIKINNTEHEIETMKKVVDSSQTKDKLNEIDKLKKKYDVLNKYYGQAYVIAMAIDNKSIISSVLIGKIFSLWFPIMLFVMSGFEHSVANMYFIPLGMFLGAPVTWGQIWLNNLIPVTIGNLIGGALIVPLFYYVAYMKTSAPAAAKDAKA